MSATENRFGGAIPDLRRHAARGMLLNGAYQVGVIAIAAVKGLVVAAFLSRSDYGVWGLVGLTMWTALALKSQFGAGERYVQQSEPDQELAFQKAFTVELIFAAAAAPVAIAVVLAFAAISGKPEVIAPGLALLLLLPATALQFPLAAFYRRMDFRTQRLLQSLDPILGTATAVLLAALGAGYWSLVVGLIAGSWAAAIVALRASPYRLALRFDRAALRAYAGFSAPLFVAAFAVLGLFQVIYLVGAVPLGLAGLGAFTLVGNLVQFTDQADAIVTETLYPAVCAVADRAALMSEIFVKSNRLSLMWAVPFGVGMTLFGGDLINFCLGDHWRPAIPLLEIMGLVTAANHVGYNWSAFVKARGMTWPIAVTAALVSAVVIAAGIPLMYSDHLRGIGWAFAAGAVVALVARSVVMARLFENARFLPHLLRAALPTAVACVPVLGLRALAGHEGSLGAAAAMFAVYVAATAGATVAFERPLLREAVGYLRRRAPGGATVTAGA